MSANVLALVGVIVVLLILLWLSRRIGVLNERLRNRQRSDRYECKNCNSGTAARNVQVVIVDPRIG